MSNGENKTSFIDDLVNKRRYMASSVSIVETIDPLRLDELVTASYNLKPRAKVRDDAGNQVDWDIQNRLVWNIQTGRVFAVEKINREAKKYALKDAPGIESGAAAATPLEEQLTTHLMDRAPTLLVIKWFISNKQSSSGAPPEAEALSRWLFEWSQNPDILAKFSTVIVVTSSSGFFSPEILRWCGNPIEVPPSTDNERREILEALSTRLVAGAKGGGEKVSAIPVTPELINATRGLNLHDTMTAAHESFSRYKDFQIPLFSDYKAKSILSAFRINWIEPSFGFESVYGFDYLKNYLVNRVLDPLVQSEKYLAEGITPPKGVVLYGPPRVGKTYTAYALGKASGLSVITLDASDFMGSLVGQTEARLKQVVLTIEGLAPVIVFIDEIDQLLIDRSRLNDSTDSGVTSRMVGGFLKWLGDPGRKAFVFGATNYLQRIDTAFLSQGRLDKSLMMLYPDQDSRLAILRAYSKGRRLAQDVDFEDLAQKTQWWNSAELANLSVEAAYVRFDAKREAITHQDYLDAMSRAYKIDPAVRKTETANMIHIYQTHAPNYEPWLLEKAKESMKTKDKDIADALSESL
jgi:ATP-dependent 26S proteasome regulatory subunit